MCNFSVENWYITAITRYQNVISMVFLVILAANIFLANARHHHHHHNVRIVGGKMADAGQFPYMALIRTNTFGHCGGSIIDKRFILTAAHCLEKYEASELNVQVGVIYRHDKGTVYEVEKIIENPGYNASTLDGDIGLLKLKEDIVFTDKVQPVEINKEDVYKYKEGIVSGWGQVGQNDALSDDLLYIRVDIEPEAECDDIRTGQVKTKVCAGVEDGIGFCSGDSGGPLVKDGVQLGVVSAYIGKCSQHNIYERVDVFAKWIESELQK